MPGFALHFSLIGRVIAERSLVVADRSQYTGQPLGQWADALFSVEAENEAFGHAKVTAKSAGCDLKGNFPSFLPCFIALFG